MRQSRVYKCSRRSCPSESKLECRNGFYVVAVLGGCHRVVLAVTCVFLSSQRLRADQAVLAMNQARREERRMAGEAARSLEVMATSPMSSPNLSLVSKQHHSLVQASVHILRENLHWLCTGRG